MRATTLAVSLAFAASTVAVAQDAMMPPSPEMAKFAPLVGNWQGTGTVRMTPDGPVMPWTSTSTMESVLGGHFILDHVKIESEVLPAPLIFQSISGWDKTRERYVALEMGSSGGGTETTVYFAGNKMISASSGVEDGAVYTDRWVTVIDGDEVRFTGHRSIDGDPFFVHIEGRNTRGGTGFSVGPETAAYAMAPPHDDMKPLGVMIGAWDFEGGWVPMAGAESMPLSGHETTEAVLGGHVLRSHVIGQGGGFDYEAFSFLTWSDAENCLVLVGANNMGQYDTTKCWVDGGRLLSVAAGAYEGQPTATRAVMDLTEARLTTRAHTTAGIDEPFLSFTGTWTRAKVAQVAHVVEAACGQCQFDLPGQGCDLAVRIDGVAHYVDGSGLDDHGDAHGADGLCNAVRKARVTGAVVDGRFQAGSFELLPSEGG